MICPNCGYSMSAFDRACPRCAGQGVPLPQSPPSSPPPAPGNSTNNSRLSLEIWSAALTLLLMFLAPGVVQRIGAFAVGNPTPTTPLFRWQGNDANQPYDSWPLENSITKKRVVRWPSEIVLGKWGHLPADLNAGRFSAQSTIDVTNGFTVPIGAVTVVAQFKNAQNVVVDQQERSTGTMQPKEKWQLSFSSLKEWVTIEVSDVLVSEP